ncbi:MAG: DUF4340 domain-containing protein [Porphyromonadaceae bacterium]|nr:MAG: DUF4340 domain-containing protein [Porphyromonadaceae bacterium]
MKKNRILIGLIIVLGIVTIILVSRNNNSSIKRELRDFAVEDTASVDRIFMVRKDNQQVTLTRMNDHWMVNDKYVVRTDAIDNLLKTLNRIRVKSPVSTSMLDNAVRMLATRNTKVEVYHKRKLLKTIYVGGPTQDQMGTFMMLEGSSVPFVIHIPGFAGYLSTRFFVDEIGWKSTELFKYNFNDIKAISVINEDNPKASFHLASSGNNQYSLTLPDGASIPGTLDTVGVRFYISQFEKVNFEFFADSTPQRIKDSLLGTKPYRILTLEDNSGKARKLIAWKRTANGKVDNEGNPMIWDDERLWALIDDKSWVVIQFYVFNSLFANSNNFVIPAK